MTNKTRAGDLTKIRNSFKRRVIYSLKDYFQAHKMEFLQGDTNSKQARNAGSLDRENRKL